MSMYDTGPIAISAAAEPWQLYERGVFRSLEPAYKYRLKYLYYIITMAYTVGSQVVVHL